jgi:hypothetical protein
LTLQYKITLTEAQLYFCQCMMSGLYLNARVEMLMVGLRTGLNWESGHPSTGAALMPGWSIRVPIGLWWGRGPNSSSEGGSSRGAAAAAAPSLLD